MIRTVLTALAMICMATIARAETPFNPYPSTGDAVVTKLVWPMNNPTPVAITVYHHADWVRIDHPQSQSTFSMYYNKEKRIGVWLRHGSQGYRYLSAQLNRCEYCSDSQHINTGKQETYLGESCTIWSLSKSYNTEVTSCVTADGIELWKRHLTSDGKSIHRTEATSLVRRMVEPQEVHPPKDVFHLSKWLDGDPQIAPQTKLAGYETLLQVRDMARARKTIRKSGPWLLNREVEDSGEERIVSRNVDKGFSFTVRKRNGVPTSLWMERRPSGPPETPGRSGNIEKLFGEECEWIDPTQKISGPQPISSPGDHLYTTYCRTADGIDLKIRRRWGNGRGYIFEATQFRRGTIPLMDAMPPKELLERKTWGFPE